MRRKTVTYDGVSLEISPLSLSQTETFLKPLSPDKRWQDHQIDMVVMALNNAAADHPWTRERITEEFDLTLLNSVFNDVLVFTGLKIEASAPAGESIADSPAAGRLAS